MCKLHLLFLPIISIQLYQSIHIINQRWEKLSKKEFGKQYPFQFLALKKILL